MKYGDKPLLYPKDTTAFTNNGLGFLPDAMTCYVTEEINGEFELEMTYPISGNNFSNINMGCIISAPSNAYSDYWQPFRVIYISKPHNGIVTYRAEHKSAELNGYPCLPDDTYIETAGTPADFITFLNTQAAAASSALGGQAYTFATNITGKTAKWSIDSITSVKTAMNYAAKLFDGEWVYDRATCTLVSRRGENRGVNVRYGSNMRAFTQTQQDNTYTHILPYWTNGTENVYISGTYLQVNGVTANMAKKAKIVDLSAEFDEKPTSADLLTAAQACPEYNYPPNYELSQEVSFVSRGQTEEYATISDLDHVELGDDVGTIMHPLNVESTSRCRKIVYDVLKGANKSAVLGVVKATISDTISKSTVTNKYPEWWVSTAEPKENFKSGDYWIKIDNEVTRKAQALGRFTGGKWLLLCEYGGTGGGVGENLSPYSATAERFNDYSEILLGTQGFDYNDPTGGSFSTCPMDHLHGYHNYGFGSSGYIYNDIVYRAGANTFGGQHNYMSDCLDCSIDGKYNKMTGCQECCEGGASNQMTGCYYTEQSGTLNTANNCQRSYLTGVGAIYRNLYDVIAATNNGRLSDLEDVFMTGSGTVMRTKRSIVVGSGNQVGVNTTGNTDGQSEDVAVVGDVHILKGHCANLGCFGDGNELTQTGGTKVSLVAGHYCTATAAQTLGAIVLGDGASLAENDPYQLVLGCSGSNGFAVDYSGNVTARGGYGTMGADYAEYFEWAEKSEENRNRRGWLVEFCGDKIVPAHGNDFIGVISVKPSIVGNAYDLHWHGKYETNEFGETLYDEAGKPIISERYDKTKRYIPRSQRPDEWAAVGLLGRLVIVDDGSCIPGGYVSARHGIGTKCYAKTNARVLRRINANHVEVLVGGR